MYKAACGLKIVRSTTTYSFQTNFLDQVCPSNFTNSGNIISLLSDEQKTLVFLKDHWTDRSVRYRGGVTGILAY